MADGSADIIQLRSSREIAWRAGLRVVEQAPAGRHDFSGPASRYMPAETLGAVYIGTVRFEAEQVEALLAMLQREANRTGDWTVHDALQAARDGITEPPEAA